MPSEALRVRNQWKSKYPCPGVPLLTGRQMKMRLRVVKTQTRKGLRVQHLHPEKLKALSLGGAACDSTYRACRSCWWKALGAGLGGEPGPEFWNYERWIRWQNSEEVRRIQDDSSVCGCSPGRMEQTLAETFGGTA